MKENVDDRYGLQKTIVALVLDSSSSFFAFKVVEYT
jgi:hypothetical protein